MGGTGLAVRARVRREWRSLLGLALLGGLGLGITLACLAGARRTDTAFDRFVEASRPGDVEVSLSEDTPLDERLRQIERVEALPQVQRAAAASWVFHTLPDAPRDALITIAALDENIAHELKVPRLIEGSLPDPDRADELFINEVAADNLDLGPGDTIELSTVPADQADLFFSNQAIDGELRSFTVTGIARYPEDLEVSGSGSFAYLTPAYWEANAGDLAFLGPSIFIDVAPGQRAAFDSAVAEFLPPSAITDLGDDADADVTVGDATGVQAAALLMFAAVLGLATLAFVVLGYSRQVLSGDEDARALRSLGMGRRQRWIVLAAPTLLTSILVGGLAAALAVALSPIFPFGLAGRAEPDPGLHLDGLVVLGGGGAAVLLLSAVGTLVALVGLRRRAATRTPAERPLPLPLVPELGVRLATRPGRGGRAIPIRSAVVTGAIGVALFVATLTFGHSIDRLVSEPLRYGWNVDVITGTSDDPDTFDDIAPILRADDRVGEWAVASMVELSSHGPTFHVLGLEAVEGDIGPVIIEGRAPTADGEIALGRETLADLDASIGDDIDASPVDGGNETQLRVVGMSLLPGGDHDFPGGLGSGGVMTLHGLRQLADAPRDIYFVRVADGHDPQQVLDELQAMGAGFYGPRPGPKIDNLDRASSVVPALAVAIAVLAFIALTHALAVTVRRRRGDLAVLGSLGMRPRQLNRIVLWQAGVIAVIALAIGVPAGLVLAKPSWGAAARSLGVADDVAVLPPWTFLALVLSVLVITVALALWPALVAARTRPAVVLRSE